MLILQTAARQNRQVVGMTPVVQRQGVRVCFFGQLNSKEKQNIETALVNLVLLQQKT